jgi:hypothetical protein
VRAAQESGVSCDFDCDVTPGVGADLRAAVLAERALRAEADEFGQTLRFERGDGGRLRDAGRCGQRCAVKIDGDRQRRALKAADAVRGHRHQQEHQNRERKKDSTQSGEPEAAFGCIALPQPRLEGGHARHGERLSHKPRGTA